MLEMGANNKVINLHHRITFLKRIPATFLSLKQSLRIVLKKFGVQVRPSKEKQPSSI